MASEPSPLDVLSQTEQCVVCGDSADGFHYGVRSCRGCNAFFRRAITYDQHFTCRRVGRCPVDRTARCACRACRLAKCIAVGMDKKAVQPKREGQSLLSSTTSTGKPSSDRNLVAHGSDLEYDRSGHMISPKLEADNLMSPSSAFTHVSGTPVGSLGDMFMPALPPSPPPNCGLITRQCYDYSDQKRRRRAMLCRSLEEILANDCDTAVRSIATAEDYTNLFQVQMVLMFEWAEKLPEFSLLSDPMDKTRLLRSFALRYILLDNVFHTMEMGYTDRVVLVNNNYMKPFEPPEYHANELADETMVKMLMFGHETKAMLDDLIIPMMRMGLTVGEMMTLRMIMFWNPGNVGLTPQGVEVARGASNNAVRELHIYFEGEGITDVEHRIGNLLLLLPSFTFICQITDMNLDTQKADTGSCLTIGVPTVTNLGYRVAQFMHIILCSSTIIFTTYLFFRMRKRLYFHRNINILIAFMFICANILALQMLVMQIHHLFWSFFYLDPCEVYFTARTCFPYMIVNSLATSYLTSVQVCMCIERLVATIMIKRYEAYSGHLVWLLITVAIVLMGILIYTTFADVPLDEDFLTCISIPAFASEKTNRNFLILISLNFLSIISLGALNFMNQKYRVKFRFNVADRYQIEENLATTKYIFIIVSFQFVVLTFYGTATLILRIYKGSLNEVVHRSCIMYAYSVPYFTCLLPILMMFILSQGIKSRNQSINQLVSHATSGISGSNNYFNDLRKAWQ